MPTITPVDATVMLTSDHDAVRKLFKEFEKTKDSATQGHIAQQVCMELTIHAQIEEHVFYPEVRSDAELKDMVLESLEEHKQLKTLIKAIEPLGPSDEQFEPKMKVLMEDVEHHASEEEKEMFPKVRKAWGKDRLAEVGQRLQHEKTRAKGELASQKSPERRVEEHVREGSKSRG